MTIRKIIARFKYHRLHARQQRLEAQMQRLIVSLLSQNGGRVTFCPDPGQGDEDYVEYPITMTFYGKHDNPNVSMTDVYLDEHGALRVDGIEEEFCVRKRNLEVYPEHYAWILDFIAIVLGFCK